jgi:GNAT superfamily N-acetyltransferase
MAQAARVHRAAFDARLPWLSGRHTPEEDAAFFTDVVFDQCQVWGGFADGLQGFVAFRDGWIDHLYVAPASQGRGIGSHLLGLAVERQSEVRLWTFQRNAGARAFYEKRGFVAVETTDGARNEEREPDVLYRWRAVRDPAG